MLNDDFERDTDFAELLGEIRSLKRQLQFCIVRHVRIIELSIPNNVICFNYVLLFGPGVCFLFNPLNKKIKA